MKPKATKKSLMPLTKKSALETLRSIRALQTALNMQHAELKNWRRRMRVTQRLIDERLRGIVLYCHRRGINSHDFVATAFAADDLHRRLCASEEHQADEQGAE